VITSVAFPSDSMVALPKSNCRMFFSKLMQFRRTWLYKRSFTTFRSRDCFGASVA